MDLELNKTYDTIEVNDSILEHKDLNMAVGVIEDLLLTNSTEILYSLIDKIKDGLDEKMGVSEAPQYIFLVKTNTGHSYDFDATPVITSFVEYYFKVDTAQGYDKSIQEYIKNLYNNIDKMEEPLIDWFESNTGSEDLTAMVKPGLLSVICVRYGNVSMIDNFAELMNNIESVKLINTHEINNK